MTKNSISQIKSANVVYDLVDIYARDQIVTVNDALIDLNKKLIDITKSGGTLDNMNTTINNKIDSIMSTVQVPTSYTENIHGTNVGKIWVENHIISSSD